MMKYLMVGIVVVMAGWASSVAIAQKYSIVLKRPNGERIPKIMGASGDLALTAASRRQRLLMRRLKAFEKIPCGKPRQRITLLIGLISISNGSEPRCQRQ